MAKKKKRQASESLRVTNPITIVSAEVSQLANKVAEELAVIETVERARLVLTEVQERLDKLVASEELDADNYIITRRETSIPDISELSSFIREED